MSKQWNRRSVISAAVMAAAVPVSGVIAATEKKADPVVKGKLTDQTLGNLLQAMGLETKVQETRYDFGFKATIEDQEWELSMSTVLSQDASSVWVMAWLDELPKSAADVPRTALLRLLSDNDKLGKGKFFAYIAANRRFVLQRVVPNEGMTAEKFRAVLDDLGESVVATHPHWSVSNWTSSGDDPAAAAKAAPPVKGSLPASGVNKAVGTQSTGQGKVLKTGVNNSKLGDSQKK
ncbi:type III secretion system chaperone [Schlesneria sp. DSM 10557]|uniref:type III secretion system chaperone n=1 Tax=Schlesneria sp. DSM 10557 TaxID=3044399 RepID=UPI0035A13959